MGEEVSFYDIFTNCVLASFRRLLAQGIAEVEDQTPSRRTLIIKIEDKVSKLRHLVDIKVSEREWPIPPSLAELYLERFWSYIAKKLPHSLVTDADHTVFIVGNFTSGVSGRSYVTRRISGKSTLVYYVQRRHKAIRDIKRKIMEILAKFYSARLKRIHEVKQHLEERGLDTRYLDLNRIEAFLTILCMWVDRILQEV